MEVEKLKGTRSIEVEWAPYFLRPDIPPEGIEMPERYRQMGLDPHSPIRQRFDAAGLVMKDRARIPSTRLAHEAVEYAREHGAIDVFHASLLRRYWAEAADLSDWAVLGAAATEAGLDPVALRTAVEAGTYAQRVLSQDAEARAMGITGIPTFILGGKYAVVGAQDVSVFEQVLAKLEGTGMMGG